MLLKGGLDLKVPAQQLLIVTPRYLAFSGLDGGIVDVIQKKLGLTGCNRFVNWRREHSQSQGS